MVKVSEKGWEKFRLGAYKCGFLEQISGFSYIKWKGKENECLPPAVA